MKRKSGGYLTVFLALSLTAMLSLILTMAEAARIRVIRARTETVTDTAVCSVLSEFSRELFEQYDLLFVDAGYGGAGSLEHVRDRLEFYLKKNYETTGISLYGWPGEFSGLQLASAGIPEARFAADSGGAPVREQIYAYMAADPAGEHLCKVPPERFSRLMQAAVEAVRAAGGKPLLTTLPPIDPKRYLDWVCRNGLSRDRILQISPTIVSGSLIRPAPSSPQASIPLSGPIIRTPRSFSTFTLFCVAGAVHIPVFIAGATRIWAFVASSVVESISSAIPDAILARMFAVAGATTKISASLARATCSTFQYSGASKVSVTTWFADRVWNVSGAMNSVAFRVMIT